MVRNIHFLVASFLAEAGHAEYREIGAVRVSQFVDQNLIYSFQLKLVCFIAASAMDS